MPRDPTTEGVSTSTPLRDPIVRFARRFEASLAQRLEAALTGNPTTVQQSDMLQEGGGVTLVARCISTS